MVNYIESTIPQEVQKKESLKGYGWNNFITESKSRLGFFTDDTQVAGEIFSGEVSYIKIYDGIKR